jgi:23S rRNA (uracil1939-C5)-methyltransferase
MTARKDNLPPLQFLYGTGEPQPFRFVRPLYGGDFLTEDGSLRLPFVLRKELVEQMPDGTYRLAEAAVERVQPSCPHFKVCGGCQYQMSAYSEQLNTKRIILGDILNQAGIADTGTFIPAHSAEPYGYRNRIRLRLQRIDGQLRVGYNVRTTTDFLPITTCPIAAPILLSIVQSILAAATTNKHIAYWLNATSEIELFCNHDQTQVLVTIFCAPRTKSPPKGQPGHFANAFAALQTTAPQLTGAAAIASDPRTGPTGRTLAEAGAPGLSYVVPTPDGPAETYWITRGGFFQVNRFLIETLVRLVCFDSANQPRTGTLAWDLFAGVGLFSRILARRHPARHFTRITAVEANPTAARDLAISLAKLSPQSSAIEATTLDFLRRGVLDRDRPGLIVLDPPRAGAGPEACELLNRIAAPTLIYVSCDPTTLARDLAVLQPHYRITHLHLVDLFPQTFHLETIAILQRTS